MPVARACSECGKSLEGRPAQTRTCGNACRLKRSRRQRASNEAVDQFAENNNLASQEIRQIVRNESTDVISRVLKDELKPIVREAMTEDVLRAINELIGLTPTAVAALHEDLESTDATIRQRAYTLLIKYTVGHPALVKPDEIAAGQQMEVHFHLPRPDAPDPEVPIDATEIQECDMCHEAKPATEFVAGSARCTACFETWRATVMERFA